MANWREQKRKALGDVHRQFQLPAVYLSHAGGTPIPVRVRLHRKNAQSQPLQVGDWVDAASNVDLNDRIIFEAAVVEGMVLTSAYAIFSPSEGYNTGPSSPAKDGYIAVEVSPMSARELEKLMLAVDLSDPAWAEIQ
ncbi:head-tail attachment protein [Rhodobacter phage RcCWillis]|nr:head-tail attachment protein [Rhodobacter phage RcCWillis]